ncbi:hypothetical protein [Mesorhizobium sp.]|uniref:hypothetical protein n=1 Tax=Mesorhizobium sp. TaxID=1871066 RepID=UPI0025804422|nr:hypothetical protein [Mesorhizobium sp.]
MNRRTLLGAMVLTPVLALPAYAHHPGADLDRLMGSEEKYFQAIDAPAAPGFELADDEGNPVRLSTSRTRSSCSTSSSRAAPTSVRCTPT